MHAWFLTLFMLAEFFGSAPSTEVVVIFNGGLLGIVILIIEFVLFARVAGQVNRANFDLMLAVTALNTQLGMSFIVFDLIEFPLTLLAFENVLFVCFGLSVAHCVGWHVFLHCAHRNYFVQLARVVNRLNKLAVIERCLNLICYIEFILGLLQLGQMIRRNKWLLLVLCWFLSAHSEIAKERALAPQLLTFGHFDLRTPN
jgi:hypothetical protein